MSRGESKPFYSFMKRKAGKTESGDPSSYFKSIPVKQVAEDFNEYFQSVFTPITVRAERVQPHNNKIVVSQEGVEKMIKNLKKGKAPGPDMIRKEDLTVQTFLTSVILRDIFQYSLDQGTLPTIWKTANVVPIFEKRQEKCLF